MYSWLRNLLFLFDAEKVHYFAMNTLKALCSVPVFRNLVEGTFVPNSRDLQTEAFGLKFRNPVGLAAGFDKNAKYLRELSALGFGFIEIGTVTPVAQAGNIQPRLFRLKKDKALINRMGFNNDGVQEVVSRLKEFRARTVTHKNKRSLPVIIGGNIGKNKVTPNIEAHKDYLICFRELFDYVDYFVVNVSSPNTPGLRELQQKEALFQILTPLINLNNTKNSPKPILLKVSPDLDTEEFRDIYSLAEELKIAGLVVANTTVSRNGLITSKAALDIIGAGGVSGLPLREKAENLLTTIQTTGRKKLPLISSGGIFDGNDAFARLNNGAVLVQVWTAFIYEGPSVVRKICDTLLRNNFIRKKSNP